MINRTIQEKERFSLPIHSITHNFYKSRESYKYENKQELKTYNPTL